MHDRLSRSTVLKHSMVIGLVFTLCLACESSTENSDIAGEEAEEMDLDISAGEGTTGGNVAGERAGEDVAGEEAGESVAGAQAGESTAGAQAGESMAGEAGPNPGPMCTDASQCPVPPPIALVECEDEWVVDVVFTPICVDGFCDMERSTRQQRDCRAENRVCRDGECLTPPPPQTCSLTESCADGELCVYNEGLCGAVGFSDGLGRCEVKSEVCGTIEETICGCDGQPYSNACTARSVGVDVSRFGGCSLGSDSSSFTCGTQSCTTQTYCAISMNDVIGPDQVEYTANCAELPDLCQDGESVSCTSCFEPDLFMTCMEVGEQMIVVYPGG